MTILRDEAGNPLDQNFNTAVFTGVSPLTPRSIFVDHGPIARPPLTVQSGTASTINGPDTITLTGATLTSANIGQTLVLTASTVNAGSFLILAVLTPTKVRVRANLRLPDAANGTIDWAVIDPRDGQIADDPDEVTVRVNGVPVVPEAVVGLLGQIVLPSAPGPADSVKVDYSWVPNPTVEIRRLNSKEFRLNGWNRNAGQPKNRSQHQYRYNNILITPSEYVASDSQALLDQPLQRDLKYRAYERAYTAVLNDPNLLRLNSPTHRIAFPPLERTIEPTFVSYTATALPEADSNPWVRHGAGSAGISGFSLVVTDASSGPFPTGQPIFWTKPLDLLFEHTFAASWRMRITSNLLKEGVFTGVAAGYSDDTRAIVVGYLDDGGTKKIGFLKAGAGNDPSSTSGWIGGLSSGNPTGAPVAFDWSVVHSFRIFRDLGGVVRLFVDGDVTETLRVLESELPFLEELEAPFDELEGAFFGSLSRAATNVSEWDFYRYNVVPTNPLQTAPSVFVSYEGTTTPETAPKPWTPIGFAGTETILNSEQLLLDSTSAAVASTEGLVGGDFKAFTRLEPLLSSSSDVVLDVELSVRTLTHGIKPNAVMAAVDDGNRLTQLSFFADKPAPKISYGGHSLPEDFSPTVWQSLGTAPVEMRGRILRITDTSASDGKVYFSNDLESLDSDLRVVSSLSDYIFEFRTKVISYTADGGGFCGVTGEVYDGLRSVGLLFRQVAGVRYLSFHSDGVVNSQFAFEWNDGKEHTYRLVKSTSGNLVTLFADAQIIGTAPYSSFSAPGAGITGVVSFGSSTTASMSAQSTVEWTYANAWRVLAFSKRYVGIWKGHDSDQMMGYHLPVLAQGQGQLEGTMLFDPNASFVSEGVQSEDYIVIDDGPNRGMYSITSVSANVLTIQTSFPLEPSDVTYRIPKEIDWRTPHRYRLVRDPGGAVSLLLDTQTAPLIRVEYSAVDLPSSAVGVPRIISGGLPSISFGALDPTELSQSLWEYVRYGITKPGGSARIAPHHQVLNQRNVIASPEHVLTSIPHTHTDFWSRSTGIPSQVLPDFLRDPNLVAFTLLNEATPLVPSTQTFEVRQPTVVNQPIAGLNSPEAVLNSSGGFVLNNGETRLTLLVPDDVLYNNLRVIETQTGEPDCIAPFEDGFPRIGPLFYQQEVCQTYDGNTLPELAALPWSLTSDNPANVSASAFGGILTYGTNATGTRTRYQRDTGIVDAPGLTTQAKFRVKLLSDSTGGTGDSKVRFGFSAPGLNVAVALVTSSLGERYVLVIDQTTQQILLGKPFNFLDGNFHDYRLVREPGASTVSLFIDS